MGNVHDYDGDGVMDDNGYITDGGDIYTLTPTDGGFMVMAFEGNANTYWNGSTN